MCSARELRARARGALRGRWGTAVITAILATMLSSGLGSAAGTDTGSQNLGLQQMEALNQFIWMFGSISAVFGIVVFIIGGATEMGYAHFNLRLVDGEPVRIGMLFEHFDRLGAGICMVLWRSLLLALWSLPLIAWLVAIVFVSASPDQFMWILQGEDPAAAAVVITFMMPTVLLLCIPMMIASYRYYLMPYLMAENPGLKAREAMRLSKQLMRGNKWRAFCLRLSFLGWVILCAFTFGIGILWLQPYIAAADAAFYREVCSHRDITQPESLNRSPEF